MSYLRLKAELLTDWKEVNIIIYPSQPQFDSIHAIGHVEDDIVSSHMEVVSHNLSTSPVRDLQRHCAESTDGDGHPCLFYIQGPDMGARMKRNAFTSGPMLSPAAFKRISWITICGVAPAPSITRNVRMWLRKSQCDRLLILLFGKIR